MTSFNAHRLKMQRQLARDWRKWPVSAPAAPEVVPADQPAHEFKPGDRVIYHAFNPVTQIDREMPGVVVNVNGWALVALDGGGHAWVNPVHLTPEQPQ